MMHVYIVTEKGSTQILTALITDHCTFDLALEAVDFPPHPVPVLGQDAHPVVSGSHLIGCLLKLGLLKEILCNMPNLHVHSSHPLLYSGTKCFLKYRYYTFIARWVGKHESSLPLTEILFPEGNLNFLGEQIFKFTEHS